MANLIKTGLPFLLVQAMFLSFVLIKLNFEATDLETARFMVYLSGGFGLFLALANLSRFEDYLHSAMLHCYATAGGILVALFAYQGNKLSIFTAFAVAFASCLICYFASRYNTLIKNVIWELATPISVGLALYLYLSSSGSIPEYAIAYAVLAVPVCITTAIALTSFEFEHENNCRRVPAVK